MDALASRAAPMIQRLQQKHGSTADAPGSPDFISAVSSARSIIFCLPLDFCCRRRTYSSPQHYPLRLTILRLVIAVRIESSMSATWRS